MSRRPTGPGGSAPPRMRRSRTQGDRDTGNPEIEAQIKANPDDPAPYQIYADWLQERGDPRGELINLQVARQAATGQELAELGRAARGPSGSRRRPIPRGFARPRSALRPLPPPPSRHRPTAARCPADVRCQERDSSNGYQLISERLLSAVSTLVDEEKQRAAFGVLAEVLSCGESQPIERPAHVLRLRADEDANRRRDHRRAARTSRTRASVSSSKPTGTRTTSPLAATISSGASPTSIVVTSTNPGTRSASPDSCCSRTSRASLYFQCDSVW
jgi:uncharacterized protein (TIGR02996 family)